MIKKYVKLICHQKNSINKKVLTNGNLQGHLKNNTAQLYHK